MKREFSSKWNSSSQPRKQRKFIANAPLHLKKNLLSAHLSKDLRQKYGRRAFSLRKGDTIKIMAGVFKKKTGKINSIDYKNAKVSIEGIQITKKDGSKVNAYIHPSKLLITELNLEDKKRLDSIKKQENKITEKETKGAKK